MIVLHFTLDLLNVSPNYVYMHVAHASWPSSNGKIYQSIHLRESYREGKHVRKRNIANLTHCDPQEIAAIELALKSRAIWPPSARSTRSTSNRVPP